MIASGSSSPRRLRVGHVRDTVLEVQLVTGAGRIVRGGGRTVKNVTGYDLPRLMTGSLGTLGVIVQVALKLRPLPAAGRTVTIEGSLPEAGRALERIPSDLIVWTAHNSHRRDLEFTPLKDRFERTQLTEVLAPDERAIEKWNSNPYRPDGGANGMDEEAGTIFLLPYWMGRYHGWVK